MVENVANFTQFHGKPSIFEVLAENALENTLHPALRRVALVLATNKPQYFQWLNAYFEETYLVFNTFLQHHYLKHYGASFAENFYGLHRMPLQPNLKLSTSDKYLSLLTLTLLPYLKRKLQEKVQMYRMEKIEGALKANFNGFRKNVLIFLFSAFEVTWGSWLLVNYLKYLVGDVEAQTPLLGVLNMKLAYAENNDDIASFWRSLFSGQLSFSEFSAGLVKNAVVSSLELTAFFLQFLQAWNREKSNYNLTALPAVEAPNRDNEAEIYKNKCPLCLQFWKIPTVLPVSGYVFCFPCILRYVRENQKCPVTNLPAKPLDIIRLFDTNE